MLADDGKCKLLMKATGSTDATKARQLLRQHSGKLPQAIAAHFAPAVGREAATEPSDSALWHSIDPRTHEVVPYSPAVSGQIEAAYQTPGGQTFRVAVTPTFSVTIDFATLSQMTDTGGQRPICRIPQELPGWAQCSGPVEPGQHVGLDGAAVAARARVFDAVEKRLSELRQGRLPRHLAADLRQSDVDSVLRVYADIIQVFSGEPYRSQYSFGPHDTGLLSLRPGDQVPVYWANVDMGESIWRRKMLSLAGLRNLVIYGSEILGEMAATMFSGCPDDYHGVVGPSKMRYYTGNSVDLDTVVLRCSDPAVLSTVNAGNKAQGMAAFATTQDFGASSQARRIAVAAAGPLIDQFCQQFRLSDSQRDKRKLKFDAGKLDQDVPVATSNSDRGRWPVWQYMNEGVHSFHVNVPVMQDVYGALLLSPWCLAKQYCLLLSRFPAGSPERDTWLADFFDTAVADTCFNAKWKSIEEFGSRLASEGTLRQRLADLMRDEQGAFRELYDRPGLDDSERDRLEAQLLLSFVERSGLKGVDKVGVLRSATLEDCVKHVADASAPL
eukprot:TRINITY_DN2084_c0_g1_i1.p1 TRINITY_DN2084_c0_g1~~TRINITY_DN2084_c0_g1_i1.p1  ORF type:complete len:571 (+),score=143.78 TRINITY_DN2084_c0_g1_i1:50-1714(+)